MDEPRLLNKGCGDLGPIRQQAQFVIPEQVTCQGAESCARVFRIDGKGPISAPGHYVLGTHRPGDSISLAVIRAENGGRFDQSDILKALDRYRGAKALCQQREVVDELECANGSL